MIEDALMFIAGFAAAAVAGIGLAIWCATQDKELDAFARSLRAQVDDELVGGDRAGIGDRDARGDGERYAG